ncbi:MAG: DNA cytosine methyltransferase [Acidobacteriota bacterium]|nr:DNA cytosine methyltransferase [Acidobacteriota bacterium]
MKMNAVDMFCGAGGASTGLVRACAALGVELELLAINHWPTAVQTHLLNHPNVRHKCEEIERINPREEVPSGRLNLLLAGPECTHHSNAAGGRPKNEQSRASAWNVAKWAQELYIDTILIENVPEFRNWGPLGADGKPLKSKRGETFKAFLEVLRSLGYKLEVKILNAADFGDPTTRQRLFVLARRARHEINWPEVTHSRTGASTLFGSTKRWKAAREIIDWSLQGKSIFNRKKPLKPATIARILAGLEKFGGPELKPFLVVLRNHADGRSVESPIPSLAVEGQHIGVAQPFIVPVNHGAGDLRSNSIEAPLPTLTAKANQYLVEAALLGQHGGASLRPVSQPVPTVATDGAIALVEPFMVPMYGEREGQGPRTHSVDQPVPVIPASGGGKFAVIEPVIVDVAFGGGDETRRQQSIEDPLGTLPASNRYAVAEASLVAMEHGGRELSVDKPVPTITTARGGAIGVAEAIIVSAGGPKCPARPVSKPMGTVLGRDHRALAEAFLVTAGGPSGQGRNANSIDEPLPTVLGENHRALVEPVIASYYGTNNTSPVSAPLPTVTTKDRFALVQPVINGLALDIRFRMLQPHELAAAMSFPKEYQFTGKREDVVRQIGNAWPGELAFALCKAIAKDYAPKKRARKGKAAA